MGCTGILKAGNDRIVRRREKNLKKGKPISPREALDDD